MLEIIRAANGWIVVHRVNDQDVGTRYVFTDAEKLTKWLIEAYMLFSLATHRQYYSEHI